jgi:hypothetical protein
MSRVFKKFVIWFKIMPMLSNLSNNFSQFYEPIGRGLIMQMQGHI